VSPDVKDNSALAVDTDGDCVADVNADCAPGDATLWGLPGAVPELRIDHDGGAGGTTTLAWGPPATRGGTAETVYVLVVQTDGACDEVDVGAMRTTTHSVSPGPGQLYRFLVQAENLCGRGSLGRDSDQRERSGCASGLTALLGE
jgi:hypothetical protein